MARRKGILKTAENRKNKSGVIRKPHSETLQKQYIYLAIDLMKEGYNRKYIVNHLMEVKKGKVSESGINFIMTAAHALLQKEYDPKIKDHVVLHVRRYNDNINNLLATKELSEAGVGVNYSHQSWLISRNKKIEAYLNAVSTMMQKENVLQMNSPTFTFVINEEVNVNIKETEKVPKIDISKLSFEEQIELYDLMKKAKLGDNEMISVIESNSKIEEAEIISETKTILPANIDSIKIEKYEKPIQKPDFIVDPTAKLKETLRRMTAQKLQGAGANLDLKELQYLKTESDV